jgi:hypothetical protein
MKGTVSFVSTMVVAAMVVGVPVIVLIMVFTLTEALIIVKVMHISNCQ